MDTRAEKLLILAKQTRGKVQELEGAGMTVGAAEEAAMKVIAEAVVTGFDILSGKS